MDGAFILEVSKKIKQLRADKKLTVQELATRATVSKGLISQIENGRSIPSLPVLFAIIKSLELGVGDFFSGIQTETALDPVIIRRASEYEAFEKEDAAGFYYQRILIQSIPASAADIVMLRLEPGAKREPVETAAFEYKYILSGAVEYMINNKTYQLAAGDSLFFDGRLRHNPSALGNEAAVMLIVYFFEEK